MEPNNKLTLRVIVALLIGGSIGLLLKEVPDSLVIKSFILDGLFEVCGQIFIKSLKLLVVPLVSVSLVCGVIGLDDTKKLGRIGGLTIAFYLATTAIAITLAITIALQFSPGTGFDLPSDLSYQSKSAPSLAQTIINIFPDNPIKSAANGSMLQVICFSILLGLGITFSGESGKRISQIFHDLNAVLMTLVTMLMRFAPIGIFALIAKVFATQGLQAIAPLSAYFFTVILALALQGLITYPALLTFFAKTNPISFFRHIRPAMLFAFSTASSNATIPVTLKTVTQGLKVPKSIASFTIPLGATINMDGTAIMQGVATVFISQAYNIEVGLSGFFTVVTTTTLASIGTAGVPGVGLITLAMVLKQVGLPVEGIALIIGVDRILDMIRTSINICGDATVSCIVAKFEEKSKA